MSRMVTPRELPLGPMNSFWHLPCFFNLISSLVALVPSLMPLPLIDRHWPKQKQVDYSSCRVLLHWKLPQLNRIDTQVGCRLTLCSQHMHAYTDSAMGS